MNLSSVDAGHGWQSWLDGLRETRDGGRTWEPVPVPPVPGRDGRLRFGGLPTIFQGGTGAVPVLLFRPDAGLLTRPGVRSSPAAPAWT